MEQMNWHKASDVCHENGITNRIMHIFSFKTVSMTFSAFFGDIKENFQFNAEKAKI